MTTGDGCHLANQVADREGGPMGSADGGTSARGLTVEAQNGLREIFLESYFRLRQPADLAAGPLAGWQRPSAR